MAGQRNGARTFLEVVKHACHLSHIPGFRAGLTRILGAEPADTLYGFWTPFCSYVESLIALDDFFNKRDATPGTDTADDSEDSGVG
jgi:hypothetical protein